MLTISQTPIVPPLPQVKSEFVNSLETQVIAKLRSSDYHELRTIRCRFQNGILTLTGEVSSFFLKQMAQTAVGNTEGVRRLVNQLVVVYPDCRYIP